MEERGAKREEERGGQRGKSQRMCVEGGGGRWRRRHEKTSQRAVERQEGIEGYVPGVTNITSAGWDTTCDCKSTSQVDSSTVESSEPSIPTRLPPRRPPPLPPCPRRRPVRVKAPRSSPFHRSVGDARISACKNTQTTALLCLCWTKLRNGVGCAGGSILLLPRL